MSISPLELGTLRPDIMETLPPVISAVVSPAVIRIAPPTFSFPIPTSMAISPEFPSAAAPVAKYIDPEFPELDVPVVSSISPLTPSNPAFDEEMSIFPLDVSLLTPLTTRTAPPEDPAVVPPRRLRVPPISS
jgi:hypothetical protein